MIYEELPNYIIKTYITFLFKGIFWALVAFEHYHFYFGCDYTVSETSIY